MCKWGFVFTQSQERNLVSHGAGRESLVQSCCSTSSLRCSMGLRSALCPDHLSSSTPTLANHVFMDIALYWVFPNLGKTLIWVLRSGFRSKLWLYLVAALHSRNLRPISDVSTTSTISIRDWEHKSLPLGCFYSGDNSKISIKVHMIYSSNVPLWYQSSRQLLTSLGNSENTVPTNCTSLVLTSVLEVM